MTDDLERAMQLADAVGSDLDALRTQLSQLAAHEQYGVGRRLLALVAERHPGEPYITQQQALFTYKDEELPTAARLRDAAAILERGGLRERGCSNAETLALGGAVYKRRWQHGGQLEDLLESLAFYRAAWTRNPDSDVGYGGVNAAFVLDLLSARARTVATRSGTEPGEADALAGEARALREDMRQRLPALLGATPESMDAYWKAITLAEVHFGLRDYAQAGAYLARARELEDTPWKLETSFRQLATLTRLHGIPVPAPEDPQQDWPPAWRALAELLGDKTAAAMGCVRGRVGLALSGGGFRASLFHLGVLARLAEMNVLGAVEALSTVSGGSIVGAHYYLEVKRLLESKGDHEIHKRDYIDIVRRVQKEFLAGIEANLRTRTLSNLARNVQMLFTPNSYTRSHRLGDLYEEHLYARVADGHPSGTPRTLPQLLVKPVDTGDAGEFKPKFHNWWRRSKVPVLILNATSLNSGHNWQFTARWMGEPPGLLGEEVDINERYRRLYYEQAPGEALKNYRLGHAVAASACVPGLFDPLVIDGLYPERTVRLVDGGVHDNQGVASLLDQGCSFILCSDASGQMADQNSPSDSTLGVPLRANSVLMDRVREAQAQDLQARVESRALDGLFFVHLKEGLSTPPVDWIGCQDPQAPEGPGGNTTDYGIDRDLQRAAAQLRTDLDSFTEVEAYALMLSGYRITQRQFQQLQARHAGSGEPGTWGDFEIDAPGKDWPFLALEPLAAQPADCGDPRRADLGQQIKVGAQLFGKVWMLDPTLRAISKIALVVAVAIVGFLVYRYWDTHIVLFDFTIGGIVLALALLAAGMVIPLLRFIEPQKMMHSYIVKAGLCLFGFVATQVHLRVFDPIFLARGRLKRLLDGDEGA